MGSAIAAIIAAVLGAITSAVTSVRSAQNAREADERALKNQMKLMEYENELQQNTNTFATQKGHMSAAGYSPALMYGSGMQQAEVSGGSAQGTMPNISSLFDKVDPNNIYEAVVTKQSQDMQRERLKSDIAVNQQRMLNLAADTAEKTRYTGVQKQLEKTIIDKAIADLHASEATTDNMRFLTRRGNMLLPGELAQQGLLNDKIARETEKVVSDTVKNSYEMAEIRANIRRLDVLNSVSAAERVNIIEDTKRSAVGRIMSQFGLNNIKIPAGFRGDWHQIWHNDQIKAASAALLSLGFDSDEVAKTVLYYTLDPKDVSPSGINAVSRLISAWVLKK